MKKTIISMGAALVLMLSAGSTAFAWHHTPCAGRVIQGSGLCWNTISHDRGHHLFCFGSGQDCAFWDIDLNGICDYWEDCHGGAASDGAVQPASNAVPEDQAGADAPAESRPTEDQAAGYQAEPRTGYEAGTEDASGAYNGYSYGNGTGYGNGGYCSPGSHTTGCHGSGHHGRGHH